MIRLLMCLKRFFRNSVKQDEEAKTKEVIIKRGKLNIRVNISFPVKLPNNFQKRVYRIVSNEKRNRLVPKSSIGFRIAERIAELFKNDVKTCIKVKVSSEDGQNFHIIVDNNPF